MQRIYTSYGFVRFICVIIIAVAAYYAINNSMTWLWAPAIIALGVLVWIIKKHQRLATEIEFTETLSRINTDEIEFLQGNRIPFDDGIQFQNTKHNYTYDLDIFGPHSLYHFLNRTAAFIGKSTLANYFSSVFSPELILKNQAAVEELKEKVEWRQELLAHTHLTNDNERMYSNLIRWSEEITDRDEKLRIASIIWPIIFIVVTIASFILNSTALQYIAGLLFLNNVGILFRRMKQIKKEVFSTDKIHSIINQYGLILSKIEQTEFDCDRLNELKNQLRSSRNYASEEIHKLSSIFSSLESIHNTFGAVIINGIGLYHIHTYHALLAWKKDHGEHVKKWMTVIGHFEALSSLANFSYNNPKNCFPSINDNHDISFKDLGHPLLNSSVRICNDIELVEEKFIILTGSNMSGKSTFLRSLGINMMLAAIGSSVCATKASIHPMSIFVSMRLSDSLADNESYFFAEVKRLKTVMDQLQQQRGFVLLDEILRGTNSDDKRSGTIEVIKKMMGYSAIGAIATHDIEVCKTTEAYPQYLVNKRFETAIVNNELLFDYKIKDGVCQNKSASFLMKQMKVI